MIELNQKTKERLDKAKSIDEYCLIIADYHILNLATLDYNRLFKEAEEVANTGKYSLLEKELDLKESDSLEIKKQQVKDILSYWGIKEGQVVSTMIFSEAYAKIFKFETGEEFEENFDIFESIEESYTLIAEEDEEDILHNYYKLPTFNDVIQSLRNKKSSNINFGIIDLYFKECTKEQQNQIIKIIKLHPAISNYELNNGVDYFMIRIHDYDKKIIGNVLNIIANL